jgi:hypothetical protein
MRKGTCKSKLSLPSAANIIYSVVFSSWTTTFDMVQSMLDASQISYVRIDGKVSQRDRSLALSRFQANSSIQVMHLSIYCGAEGYVFPSAPSTISSGANAQPSLNITAASRVYLMEPQWNPNIESQALARVHRLGQTREVTTTTFIMKDSIESVRPKRLSHPHFSCSKLVCILIKGTS